MNSGYVIGELEVMDFELFGTYVQKVQPLILQFGGKMLVSAGRLTILEGEPKGALVVIEFPSYDQALAWYHSETYATIRPIRQSSSRGTLRVVEGVA